MPIKYFHSQKEVFRYLINKGWDVSLSKIQYHCRHGNLPKRKDGYEKPTVDKWAEEHLVKRTAVNSSNSEPEESIEELRKRKLKAEIRKNEADAAKKELELKALREKWILREDFDREITARAMVLEQILRQFATENIDELVEVVEGDPARIPDAMSLYDRVLDEALNKYADLKVFYILEDASSSK